MQAEFGQETALGRKIRRARNRVKRYEERIKNPVNYQHPKEVARYEKSKAFLLAQVLAKH